MYSCSQANLHVLEHNSKYRTLGIRPFTGKYHQVVWEWNLAHCILDIFWSSWNNHQNIFCSLTCIWQRHCHKIHIPFGSWSAWSLFWYVFGTLLYVFRIGTFLLWLSFRRFWYVSLSWYDAVYDFYLLYFYFLVVRHL